MESCLSRLSLSNTTGSDNESDKQTCPPDARLNSAPKPDETEAQEPIENVAICEVESQCISSATQSSSTKAPLLHITLCRYQSRKLFTEERSLSESFIAISHVWGHADWRRINGIGSEILVSEEKATFIAEDLPALVGDSWFWMDILCVNQRNAEDRVAVTQHIPSIFRAANKTIVVRESSGFRDCCVEAAGPSSEFMGKSRLQRTPDDQSSDIDFTDGNDGRHKLRQHLGLKHQEEHFDDGVLSRLWPLQEIILSNVIQVVRCKAASTNRLPKTFLKHHEPHGLVSSLSTLAVAWDTYGSDNDTNMWHRLGTGRWGFINAYFNLGEVSRGISHGKTPQNPRARDILLHLTSTRQTSKPRDFILAIIPQYSFYRVPKTAKSMTFSELFLDCCQQMRDAELDIAPFLMDSENPLGGRIGYLSGGVPEPKCLGDLAKLLNGPVQRAPSGIVLELMVLKEKPTKTDIVKALALSGLENVMDQVLPHEVELLQAHAMTATLIHLITISIFSSKILWLSAECELLYEIHSLPEDSKRGKVATVFSLIVSWIDWNEGSRANGSRLSYSRELHKLLNSVEWEITVLMTAMVSCGMPLSAFDWAHEHLEVLHLVVNERSSLALAPKAVVEPDTMYYLRQVHDYSMGRDGPIPRVSLLARSRGCESYFRQCLFPPDLKL